MEPACGCRNAWSCACKDIDFDLRQIVVRRGKGQKDRVTMLPAAVEDRLKAHLAQVKQQHERDLGAGLGRVALPHALERKYPQAPTEWGWQFVFPAGRVCRDPRFGPPSRYHLHESVVQRAVTQAARAAGIRRPATCHSLRHHAECRIMPTAGSRWSIQAPFPAWCVPRVVVNAA